MMGAVRVVVFGMATENTENTEGKDEWLAAAAKQAVARSFKIRLRG